MILVYEFLISLMLKYLRALGMKEGMILMKERRRKVNPRSGITEEIQMISPASRMDLKKRMRLHQGWGQMNPHQLEMKESKSRYIINLGI